MKPSLDTSITLIVLMVAVAIGAAWPLATAHTSVLSLVIVFACGGAVGWETRRLQERQSAA